MTPWFPLKPFALRCPNADDLAIRTLGLLDCPPFGSGTLFFVDCYCDVTECDCRQVLFQVFFKPMRHSKFVPPFATISFGWESRPFYEQLFGNRLWAFRLTRAVLTPTYDQSRHAQYFLEVIRDLIWDRGTPPRLGFLDPAELPSQAESPFLGLIKRRYTLFKRHLEEEMRDLPRRHRRGGRASQDLMDPPSSD